jgi:hypothetical protein
MAVVLGVLAIIAGIVAILGRHRLKIGPAGLGREAGPVEGPVTGLLIGSAFIVIGIVAIVVNV